MSQMQADHADAALHSAPAETSEAVAVLCALIDASSAQIAAARAAAAELERIRLEAETARRALSHALFHAADLADRLGAKSAQMQANMQGQIIEPKPAPPKSRTAKPKPKRRRN